MKGIFIKSFSFDWITFDTLSARITIVHLPESPTWIVSYSFQWEPLCICKWLHDCSTMCCLFITRIVPIETVFFKNSIHRCLWQHAINRWLYEKIKVTIVIFHQIFLVWLNNIWHLRKNHMCTCPNRIIFIPMRTSVYMQMVALLQHNVLPFYHTIRSNWNSFLKK